jgi:hypothetical protein
MAQKNRNFKQGPNRPLEERLRIAREVNAYRAAHPKAKFSEVMQQFPGVTDKNFYAWNKLLELHEAKRKPNGAEHAEVVEHFPLAIIPEKAPKKKTTLAKVARIEVEDGQRAALADMFDSIARLLRR